MQTEFKNKKNVFIFIQRKIIVLLEIVWKILFILFLYLVWILILILWITDDDVVIFQTTYLFNIFSFISYTFNTHILLYIGY